MNAQLTGQFMDELQWQCRLADLAYHRAVEMNLELVERFEEIDQDEQEAFTHMHLIYLFVHAFLIHTAIVSRIIQPSSFRKPLSRAEVEDRGKHLIAELGLTVGPNFQDRDLRDHWEHVDERIQERGGVSQTGAMAFGVDPDTGRLMATYWGDVVDLTALHDEMLTVYEAAERWLDSHGYLRPVQS